jgi:EpsD family peptidyl-prolyl cis-trans isomerase
MSPISLKNMLSRIKRCDASLPDSRRFNVVKLMGLPISLALVLGISACEKKDESTKPTQVIAKVNDAELSVHQLNFTLQGVQEADPERMARIRKAGLDRLVEQEVLVQSAIEKKLDRDPMVRSQLDAARRDILVRSLLINLGSTVAVPPDEAIARFYIDHPELFKERLIFQFTEIVVPRAPSNWSEIEKGLAQTKTMQEVQLELRKIGLSLPVGQNIVRGAEDLPADLLKQLPKLKDGEIVIYSRPPAIVIGQINARRVVPVDEEKAKPLIIKYLATQSQNELVQSQVRRMKDAAKVSYLGEFAKDATKTVAPEKAKTGSEPGSKDAGKEVLDKGLKTLK